MISTKLKALDDFVMHAILGGRKVAAAEQEWKRAQNECDHAFENETKTRIGVVTAKRNGVKG